VRKGAAFFDQSIGPLPKAKRHTDLLTASATLLADVEPVFFTITLSVYSLLLRRVRGALTFTLRLGQDCTDATPARRASAAAAAAAAIFILGCLGELKLLGSSEVDKGVKCV
jgi:hypothetical protein